jgi:hypothetical protein
MPWNTEIDWSNEDAMVNAPPWLLLEDLFSATAERLSTMTDTEYLTFGNEVNAPRIVHSSLPSDIRYLREAMVACVEGLASDLVFIKPNSGGDYNYTNEEEIPIWSMVDMETELGPEPEFYEFNAPLTAAWVKWWYDALNLLTRVMYPLATHEFAVKDESGSTFSEAQSNFNDGEWSPWTNITSAITARHSAVQTVNYRIERIRLRTNPLNRFTPFLYTGNYLVSAWARISSRASGATYDNSDYPCNEDTYAQIFNDATVQQEEMDKDILVGDFDNATVGEPSPSERRGWSMDYDSKHQICQFDIAGGFEYVAP